MYSFYTLFSLLSVVGIPAALQLDQKSRTAKSQSSAGLKNYLSSNTRNSFNLIFYFNAFRVKHFDSKSQFWPHYRYGSNNSVIEIRKD